MNAAWRLHLELIERWWSLGTPALPYRQQCDAIERRRSDKTQVHFLARFLPLWDKSRAPVLPDKPPSRLDWYEAIRLKKTSNGVEDWGQEDESMERGKENIN
jgi:hypothetical protein